MARLAHSHPVFLVVRVPEERLQDLPVAVAGSRGGISVSRREPALHKEIISYDSVMNSCACISPLAAGGSPSYVSVCHRPSAAQRKQRILFSLRGGEPSSWHEASPGSWVIFQAGCFDLTMLRKEDLIFAVLY